MFAAGSGTVVQSWRRAAQPSSLAPVTPIRIVLADDHTVVRSGLRLLLETSDEFEVVAEASDAESALRAVLGHKPDVLVLDLNMPGKVSSVEILPLVPERSAETSVVVLTMQDDPAFARSAMQAGARAYVLKEAADTDLMDAIRQAAVGKTYLTPSMGARMATMPEHDGNPGDLTERELEILRLIALGHTNGEIAGQLYLSVRTVETHRSHIQRKLGLTTRAELVRWAIDRGLLADR